jgi:hypothetical protein
MEACMPKRKPTIIPSAIDERILVIREQKVMLDADLADLFQVSTKQLNQQVRRNPTRFPVDFMFQLTRSEKNEVVANCDHLKRLKFSASLPLAFTEHGVLMLANVLQSDIAIHVSIEVVRTFTKMRSALLAQKEFVQRLDELERQVIGHDEGLRQVFAALKALIAIEERPAKKLGFQ